MALIKCPACSRENVSDSAEACPGCGYGIKAHFEKEKEEKEQKRQKEVRRKSLKKVSIWSAIWAVISVLSLVNGCYGLASWAESCSIGGLLVLFLIW